MAGRSSPASSPTSPIAPRSFDAADVWSHAATAAPPSPPRSRASADASCCCRRSRRPGGEGRYAMSEALQAGIRRMLGVWRKAAAAVDDGMLPARGREPLGKPQTVRRGASHRGPWRPTIAARCLRLLWQEGPARPRRRRARRAQTRRVRHAWHESGGARAAREGAASARNRRERRAQSTWRRTIGCGSGSNARSTGRRRAPRAPASSTAIANRPPREHEQRTPSARSPGR